MKALALILILLLTAVAFGQEAPAPSKSCAGKSRPETKLTPKQTRDAIVDRTELPVPAGARVQGCVILEVFISEIGTVECINALHGLPLLVDSVIPGVEKWKFKAIGKHRDGTLQLCWHNGWEVGNEFEKK